MPDTKKISGAIVLGGLLVLLVGFAIFVAWRLWLLDKILAGCFVGFWVVGMMGKAATEAIRDA